MKALGRHRFLLALIPLVTLGAIVGTRTFYAEGEASPELLKQYGRLLGVYAAGRFDTVVEESETMGSFFPALILRGKALCFLGKVDQAEEVFNRALQRRPYNVEGTLFLARIWGDRGQGARAQGLLERILAEDPDNVRALHLASTLGGPGGESEGLLLDRAAEALSEGALVFIDRGRFRWRRGDSAGALGDLRTAKALLPPQSALRKSISTLESVIQEASR
jgi:tetratricopeptide (TPR) repeat protein